MSHPIPKRLREKFQAHMKAHDNEALSDGAWFHQLEQAAEAFMEEHGLNQPWRCPNDAVHRYLQAEDKP